jgi:hypothetical protein
VKWLDDYLPWTWRYWLRRKVLRQPAPFRVHRGTDQ